MATRAARIGAETSTLITGLRLTLLHLALTLAGTALLGAVGSCAPVGFATRQAA